MNDIIRLQIFVNDILAVQCVQAVTYLNGYIIKKFDISLDEFKIHQGFSF